MFRKKSICIAIALFAVSVFITGCGAEMTPYETNNLEGYSVSVKFDANGGLFTTNTSVIVDSFNIADMSKNSEGQVEIALIAPDDAARGNDAFEASKNDHFLAGWYVTRTESTDSEGNTVYSYGDRWEFGSDKLKLDPSKSYSADTPELTLYAVWVPMFEVRFFSLEGGEQLGSLRFDPTETTEILTPYWDKNTGVVEMNAFPEKSGYTFAGAYYDKAGTLPVDTETVVHPGKVNTENGMAVDPVLDLYVDWTEGEWYRIYTAEQFSDNASLSGNYEICADLDFSDEIWPTALMHGNFGGTINGNGYKFTNISFEQTNNSKVNSGLFGYVTENASITDVTFENVSFTVKAGTRVAGACYGLFAGNISSEATVENVSILGGELLISSSCYFGTSDYSIGLVCGMGDSGKIPNADIECKASGDDPESVTVTVNGNEVTVEFAE